MYSPIKEQESVALPFPKEVYSSYFLMKPYRSFFKRLLDIFLCFLILPFVLPVLLLLIIIIKLDSKGPAIYRSERIGKNGKNFDCLKLRTMCLNADKVLDNLLGKEELLKKEYLKFRKLKNDPRITRFGKILRKFSLDELPQIFNVLKGEMSFVGPRPIVGDEITKYGKSFSIYKSLSPGITGLWQVNGRNETSFHGRVEMDLNYFENGGLAYDLKILMKTVPAVLSKKGAY